MKTRNLILSAATIAVITILGFINSGDAQASRTMHPVQMPPSTTLSFAALLARPQRPSGASTTPPSDGVTDAQRAAWGKVAQCETGGNWSMQGPTYSGALGILNANWRAYGGLVYAPNAGLATEDEQILVAERIQSSPPDQWGCSGAW